MSKEFKFRPYVPVKNEVWMTDGIAEDVVHVCENEEDAKTIATLLNQTYNGAYTDGYYASTEEKYQELCREATSLAIKNYKLTQKLKQYEGEA